MSSPTIDAIKRRAAELAKVPRPDLDALQEEQKRERLEELRERTNRVSGIPPRYAKSSIDRLTGGANNRAAIDLARTIAHAGHFRRGFGMWGDVGVGKSEIACAVANAGIAAGKTAKYFTPKALFARFKNADSYGSAEAVADLLRMVAETPILILDDFASESGSKLELAFLAELINARWNAADGCLIITSNKSFGDTLAGYNALAEDAGDPERGLAIMDRVAALTGDWICMQGVSQRAYDGVA